MDFETPVVSGDLVGVEVAVVELTLALGCGSVCGFVRVVDGIGVLVAPASNPEPSLGNDDDALRSLNPAKVFFSSTLFRFPLFTVHLSP